MSPSDPNFTTRNRLGLFSLNASIFDLVITVFLEVAGYRPCAPFLEAAGYRPCAPFLEAAGYRPCAPFFEAAGYRPCAPFLRLRAIALALRGALFQNRFDDVACRVILRITRDPHGAT